MFGLPETALIYTCRPDVVGYHTPFPSGQFGWHIIWLLHLTLIAKLKEVEQGPGNREPIDSVGWEWSGRVRSLHAGVRCLGSHPSSATYMCVTWRRLLYLPGSQCPHVGDGDNNSSCFIQ